MLLVLVRRRRLLLRPVLVVMMSLSRYRLPAAVRTASAPAARMTIVGDGDVADRDIGANSGVGDVDAGAASALVTSSRC